MAPRVPSSFAQPSLSPKPLRTGISTPVGRRANTVITVPEMSPSMPVPPEWNGYCTQCGTPLMREMRFCGRCGMPLNRGAVPAGTSVLRTVPHMTSSGNISGQQPVFMSPVYRQGTMIAGAPETGLFAGFWRRTVAWFVDAVICIIVSLIIAFLAALAIAVGGLTAYSAVHAGGILFYPVLVLVAWLYGACQQSSKHQATLGQRLMNLRIVDGAGARISFSRSTGRYWATYLSWLMLGIGYLLCPFTQCKQSLHDIISGCYVIFVQN